MHGNVSRVAEQLASHLHGDQFHIHSFQLNSSSSLGTLQAVTLKKTACLVATAGGGRGLGVGCGGKGEGGGGMVL